MALINFKDLPDTTTPINSTNLNNNFDELAEINNANLINQNSVISITPTTGSNYSAYGNSWYYKKGTKVHVHIGVQGLTANSYVTLFTLPAGYRPRSIIPIVGFGSSFSVIVAGQIYTNGEITIYSTSSYCAFETEFEAFN